MRIQHVYETKQQIKEAGNLRFTQGQIVRGRVVQLYPQDLARITFGSSQFIAQLEAPLRHGERYYFQVQDVKSHVHLRVIQRPNTHEKNEWQQLLTSLGIKQTKMNEQFIQRIVQGDIPFTKRSLQQGIALLSSTSNNQAAIDSISNMMQRRWPLTNEVFQSLHTFQSSTFTDELTNTYESLMNKNTLPAPQLASQLSLWLPEEMRINQLLKPMHEYVTTHEKLGAIQSLRWFIPQIHVNEIREIEQLSLQRRVELMKTPAQLLARMGVNDHADKQVTIQSLQALSSHVRDFGQRVGQFVQMWEPLIQEHRTSFFLDEQTRSNMLQAMEKIISFAGFPQKQVIQMSGSIPSHALEVTQMINDFKELTSTLHLLVSEEGKQPELSPRTSLHLFMTQWMEHIGLSYERLIADGQTEKLLDTLKGQLLQFIQAQGTRSERAQSLLHYIQGMQLQTVQETSQTLSVQFHVPALIGDLRSDIRIEFESRKTEDSSIDPDYCRILFDLELDALERTLIDMHIQNKQVSFVIYNDTPFLKTIARTFEPSLIERLGTLNYAVSSIRYQPLQEATRKEKDVQHEHKEMEGFDVKI